MNNNKLIRITKKTAKTAIEVLEKAFESYPLLRYYYPDELNRKKILNYFLSFAIYSGIKYGEVYTTSSNMEVVTVWIPSKNYPITF
jgi:hypothetical protein